MMSLKEVFPETEEPETNAGYGSDDNAPHRVDEEAITGVIVEDEDIEANRDHRKGAFPEFGGEALLTDDSGVFELFEKGEQEGIADDRQQQPEEEALKPSPCGWGLTP